MQLEKYSVRVSSQHTGYMFISVGERGSIIKVIEYTPTNNPGEYNLGFGDYDPSTGSVSDLVKSNNGDRDRVLATVASTAIDFLTWHPDAVIFVKGSTDSRTRIYQMGINHFYNEIRETHDLFGFIDEAWEIFEPNSRTKPLK